MTEKKTITVTIEAEYDDETLYSEHQWKADLLLHLQDHGYEVTKIEDRNPHATGVIFPPGVRGGTYPDMAPPSGGER